jgi:single-strand DNA-binding protein
MRVIVQGRLKQRSYETKEGEKRTVYEIEADEIGPSLKLATAKVNKTSRGSGGGNFAGGGAAGGAAEDPWASAPSGGFSDEPPF